MGNGSKAEIKIFVLAAPAGRQPKAQQDIYKQGITIKNHDKERKMIMKNLKKTAAVLTAAAMTMSMGMTAYAAIESDGGSETHPVTGTYNAGGGGNTMY